MALIGLTCVLFHKQITYCARLFSNISQMTSKCGKNKKVAHEAIAGCVTNVLTPLTPLVLYQ